MPPDTASPAPGSKVGVHYGGRLVAAFVVEDRGIFAGRRVVRVRVGDWDDAEAPEFELPVDELEPVPAAA